MLRSALAGLVAAVAGACAGGGGSAPAPMEGGANREGSGRGQGPTSGDAAGGGALEPTPSCEDGDDPTPTQTEGPYFSADSPERTSLTGDVESGTRLVLSGTVVDTSCRPVPRALLDFWQADDQGRYDNAGYRLRGHLFTDADGRYRLETIEPGRYPGRTPHIHVKVQRPGGSVLTTQLYFPGEPANARDGLFRPQLVMRVTEADGGKDGRFTFVLRS